MVRDLRRDLARSDGLARRFDLLELGHSGAALRRAVRAGIVTSPRRGWICAADALPSAVRAVELGGRLGGASALATYGIWVDDFPLTVATARTASRLPDLGSQEVRLFAVDLEPPFGDRRWRVGVSDGLLQLARDADRSSVIASIDSALNQHLLATRQLERLLRALPARLRIRASDLDARAMSGTESKLRLACVAAGLRVESQASITSVGMVDLLIDGWLIVEVDSRRFHNAQISQHRDRVRDGNSVLGRFGFLRFDYALVQYDIDWCLRVILARLESGRP